MRVVFEILEGDQGGPSTSQTSTEEAEGGTTAAFLRSHAPATQNSLICNQWRGSWRTTSSLQMLQMTVKQNPWIGGKCMRKTFQE